MVESKNGIKSWIALSAIVLLSSCSEHDTSAFVVGESVRFKGTDGGSMMVDGHTRLVAAGTICIVEQIRRQESSDTYARWFDKIDCGKTYGAGWTYEHRLEEAN